ncbi:branched-chain amino acid ABC transporter permease [Streptomyces aidingensis]|uniref:Branched-chain amino acid transport system permease protein n=1 Tax=Streptomyces aidingensis TaxID=910347 RepID=A0A1I1IYP1_9ACTN|nr:branched-chain amino acid transport system permease protein [Streptomyces aidingensis]
MSEPLTKTGNPPPSAPAAPPSAAPSGGPAPAGSGRGRLHRRLRRLLPAAGALILLALPFYAEAFWLRAGLFAMAAAIGAIGLNLLTGSTGQLSLGHSFFLAVGAYGYCLFAGDPDGTTTGWGLPPLLAMVLAVALAGVAGGLFSPIAGRLRGAYLGIATLALIFIGQHVLFNAKDLTGGFNGRPVPVLEFLGLSFDNEKTLVAGVPFTAVEKLWYLGLVLLAAGALFAVGVLKSRPGRAMNAIRDHRIAAGVMGIPVARYRGAVFVLSSMYAGLAGVLLALVFQRTVPGYFGISLALTYLAMIVIGGLGSVGGAVLGAAFVTLIPQILTRYSESLPLISAPGTGGVAPGEASELLYGAAVVAAVLFLPGGLVRLPLVLRMRRQARRRTKTS